MAVSLAEVAPAEELAGPFMDEVAAGLESRYRERGVDTRLISEPFLEAADLGDVSSLRQQLSRLDEMERRRLVKSVDQHGCSGLLLASKSGDAEMVEILLNAAANPNDADNTGATALHYAAARGSVACLRQLLAAKADPGRCDDWGDAAVMWAAGQATVQTLIDSGAESSLRNKSGDTPLMRACARGDLGAAQALLAASPAASTALEACNSEGLTPYTLADSAGHREVADWLISMGATRIDVDSGRRLPLHDALCEAAEAGDSAFCLELIGKNADVNASTAAGTPLLLAAQGGRARVMELLLDARASPNFIDPVFHETPLMRAVLGGATNEVIWMLLEAGADAACKDAAGRTAADIARAWQRPESAAILQAAAVGELQFPALTSAGPGEMD